MVLVELPGGVTAWSVTRQRLLRDLLADPRVAANPRHWRVLTDGEVPDGWPLIDFILVRSMTTADGLDHRRLRSLITQAFTPRRVAALRSGIEATVGTLLDELAQTLADGGTADLIERFAYPLPLTVVSELLGFPEQRRAELHHRSNLVSSSVTTAEEKVANRTALLAILTSFVADHRAHPQDDLTGALINAVTEDGEVLSEDELVGTLLTLLVAGHSTVSRLITNAVRALFAHPAQRALAQSGRAKWSAVVEETLRWDSPLGHFPMRYATEDIDVGGTTIPRGDAIILSYAAVGRDPQAHGAQADQFSISRPPAQHLSFGYGVHFCLGAHLARLEGEIALSMLFERFPDLGPAVDLNRLVPTPSIISNTVQSLEITLAGS